MENSARIQELSWRGSRTEPSKDKRTGCYIKEIEKRNQGDKRDKMYIEEEWRSSSSVEGWLHSPQVVKARLKLEFNPRSRTLEIFKFENDNSHTPGIWRANWKPSVTGWWLFSVLVPVRPRNFWLKDIFKNSHNKSLARTPQKETKSKKSKFGNILATLNINSSCYFSFPDNGPD